MDAIKPLEDRITVEAHSRSTTQHALTVRLDGVAQVTFDNSYRGEFPKPGRPYFGDYRDWMEQSAEQATPWLKLWFVQRRLRFTNDPCPAGEFERRYDASIAELVRLDRDAARRAWAGEHLGPGCEVVAMPDRAVRQRG